MVFWLGYLFSFGLLEGKLHGGHSQLVGEEIHISRQLQRADVGSRAVPTTNATQQLSLTERTKDEEKEKQWDKRNSLVEREQRYRQRLVEYKGTEVNKLLPCSLIK